ncbi:ABC transporter permease [Janibacter cremeus]|uniref:Osmoprotectant transport system permease protein n=1 Tax=Janibacter cremeus TaxID=1285192 RepID=A0A852VWM4_9MICO|nr:ABC transporter permease subunit [Janibacter cremeus]NYF98654.1 osmoprotectant transport system permease protein [Janibacter cremeus]
MIVDILQWLLSGEEWSGDGGILARLLEHIAYTLLVIVVAGLIAIPAGLWIGHTGRGRWMVTVANALRAIPTLGLLFALTLVLLPLLPGASAFIVPSVAVLVLLAIPPILSGTYSGVEAVDPAALDAAHGIGMTGRQVLRSVEVPIALPLLISGIRAAVLQVVATATIAAYVGLGGLGRYLIDGLAISDYVSTAGGAVLVAVLALALDAPFALLGRLMVSPGLTGRTPRRVLRRTDPTPAGGTA